MTSPTGHTREDYEACLAWAKERSYWAMYFALASDGYDPNVNYRELMKDGEK